MNQLPSNPTTRLLLASPMSQIVARAAQWLDTHKPGWHRYSGMLDGNLMGDVHNCVFGKMGLVLGEANIRTRLGDLYTEVTAAFWVGLGPVQITAPLWRQEIRARLAADAAIVAPVATPEDQSWVDGVLASVADPSPLPEPSQLTPEQECAGELVEVGNEHS